MYIYSKFIYILIFWPGYSILINLIVLIFNFIIHDKIFKNGRFVCLTSEESRWFNDKLVLLVIKN